MSADEFCLDIDAENVCRICLSQPQQYQNIFSNTIVDGYIIPIPEMVKYCLDIKIQQSDSLPTKICSTCKTDLMGFHSFKQKSRRTEDILIKTFIKPNKSDKAIENALVHIPGGPKLKPPTVTDPVKAADIISKVVKPEPILPTVISKPKSQDKILRSPESSPLMKKIKYEIMVENDETAIDYSRVGDVSDQFEQTSSVSISDVVEELSESDAHNDAQCTDEVNINNCEDCRHYINVRNRLASNWQCLRHSVSGQQKCVQCKARAKNDAEFEEHRRQCPAAAVSIGDVVEELSESDANGQMFALEMINYDGHVDETKIDERLDSTSDDDEEEDQLVMQLDDLKEAILTDTKNVRPDSVASSMCVQSCTEYECYICNDLFEDKQQYIDHCKEHNLTCIECQLEFESADELAKHLVDVHHIVNDSDDDNTRIRNEIDADSSSHQCTICEKTIKSGRANYEFHLLSHESTNIILNSIEYFKCKYCHTVFAKTNYDAHMNTHDTTIKEECVDYQFLEDEDDIPPCGVCKVEFSSWGTEIKLHLATHMTEFLCPFTDCGCQYNGMLHLTTHIVKKHLNTNGYKCRHCSAEQFETFDQLQAHMKHSCAERKFGCKHCERKFYSAKALQLHLKTIKGKPLSCSFCEKSFASKGELKIHERSHTNERPFICTVCGNAYKTSSMRASHMDAHIQGKTFPCTLCDKKLQTRTSYRNHMKRHTEEKKHVCSDCGKKFFTKYHAKLHWSKIHAKNYEC